MIPGTLRRRFRVIVLLALLVLVVASAWTYHAVRESLVDLLTQNFQAILDADIAALEIWLWNME